MPKKMRVVCHLFNLKKSVSLCDIFGIPAQKPSVNELVNLTL